MKLSSNRAFAHQMMVGLLVTLGFGGTVGLGTVWMRHRVSVLADTNRDLEQRYHEIERRIDDVSAQVESALSPDVLRTQNAEMHLGLVELTQAQVNLVPVDPIPRLVARANRRVFEREGAGSGVRIELNLPAADTATAANPPAAVNRSHPLASNP